MMASDFATREMFEIEDRNIKAVEDGSVEAKRHACEVRWARGMVQQGGQKWINYWFPMVAKYRGEAKARGLLSEVLAGL